MKTLQETLNEYIARAKVPEHSAYAYYAGPAFWLGAASMAEQFAAGDKRLVEIMVDIANSLEDCAIGINQLIAQKVKE